MRTAAKLFKSTYNADTGVSTVVIKTKSGYFTGVAKVHPEDTSVQSKFLGCRIAEKKAFRDFYTTELKREKIRFNTIQDAIKDFSHFCPDNEAAIERLKILAKKYRINILSLEDEILKINTELQANKNYLKIIKEKYKRSE